MQRLHNAGKVDEAGAGDHEHILADAAVDARAQAGLDDAILDDEAVDARRQLLQTLRRQPP